MGAISHVDNDSWDQLLSSHPKVMVDFWADWCQPCIMMAPVLDKLASKQNQLKIAKLDTDHNPQIAMKYDIMGIPTLIIFVDGEEAHRIVGFKPQKDLERELEQFL